MAGPRKVNVGIQPKVKRLAKTTITRKETERMRGGAIDRSMDRVFGREKRIVVRWSAWY